MSMNYERKTWIPPMQSRARRRILKVVSYSSGYSEQLCAAHMPQVQTSFDPTAYCLTSLCREQTFPEMETPPECRIQIQVWRVCIFSIAVDVGYALGRKMSSLKESYPRQDQNLRPQVRMMGPSAFARTSDRWRIFRRGLGVRIWAKLCGLLKLRYRQPFLSIASGLVSVGRWACQGKQLRL
jgi:hypothetical protein